MRRMPVPLVLIAAAFVGAGGFIHAREWLDTYRHTPASTAGSAVVRIGFPVTAGVSAAVAAALVVSVFVWRRWSPWVVAGAVVFQAVSLAGLIASRTGSFLGWAEPVWTRGADQTRAVEIGALLSLAAVVAVTAIQRRSAAEAAVIVRVPVARPRARVNTQ